MLATENASSPSVHDDSVGLLAAECRAGHSCQPSGIRDALMYVLRNDKESCRAPKGAAEGCNHTFHGTFACATLYSSR